MEKGKGREKMKTRLVGKETQKILMENEDTKHEEGGFYKEEHKKTHLS